MHEERAIAERLERVFGRIHAERMAGVPILNERLRVEAVGARTWLDHWLCVLVTPWFINLMLLPGTDEQLAAWRALPLGGSALHRFPAGRFDFLVGEETELGRYQMCSLFSPVLEFENQEAAVIAAAAALEALFDASLDPTAETDQKTTGVNAEASPANAEQEPHLDQSRATVRAPAVPSRRGFLSGRIAPQGGSS